MLFIEKWSLLCLIKTLDKHSRSTDSSPEPSEAETDNSCPGPVNAMFGSLE